MDYEDKYYKYKLKYMKLRDEMNGIVVSSEVNKNSADSLFYENGLNIGYRPKTTYNSGNTNQQIPQLKGAAVIQNFNNDYEEKYYKYKLKYMKLKDEFELNDVIDKGEKLFREAGDGATYKSSIPKETTSAMDTLSELDFNNNGEGAPTITKLDNRFKAFSEKVKEQIEKQQLQNINIDKFNSINSAMKELAKLIESANKLKSELADIEQRGQSVREKISLMTDIITDTITLNANNNF